VEGVDLVVPVKRLAAAKTRLRDPAGDPAAHTRLALAFTLDTVAAARAARRVRTVLVVTADRTVAATLVASGIEVADDPLVGLNAAYDRGARLLRERDPRTAVGALQADLPALRPAELDAAIAAALATGGRAFTADAEGTGTTFLLAAAGTALEPRFGGGSAERHRASGAVPLAGAWPSLRRDVDTPADLAAAVRLGVGAHTRAALAGV
jgi:2-phospho-L-lactate guanylyltransferase